MVNPQKSSHSHKQPANFEAKKRVWVVTPYFIPDETLLKSLALSAALGRDIRIIIPARSNHILADLARGSSLRTLKEAGGKIFFFDAGMLHAKIILIDDTIAISGSANMDMRSLYLNYEIALFMYSSPIVAHIEKVINKEILSRSHIMKDRKPSLRRDVKEWTEDISRLFSPFL